VAATDPASPEYTRFVAREREAQRFPGTVGAVSAGTALDRLIVNRDDVGWLGVEAAKRASGFFRPTKRTEVVWVNGDSQLAVGIGAVRTETGHGHIVVTIPVRCDQTGPTEVHVTFAVGAPGHLTGLYAATHRRPRGPDLIVDTWGEAIVAFAWHVVLDLVTGLAGATGKDTRGNRLVPAELEATVEGLAIVPMARHRFSGSIGVTRSSG
jgi:hypothetical protein